MLSELLTRGFRESWNIYNQPKYQYGHGRESQVLQSSRPILTNAALEFIIERGSWGFCLSLAIPNFVERNMQKR